MRTKVIVTLSVILVAVSLHAQSVQLPTGAHLDPAVKPAPVGNFPLAAVMAPEGDRMALLLCGWRQQGVQIVGTDGQILQTLEQPAAFVGIAFAPDGKTLWASGGNEDALYRYAWRDGAAVADGVVPLAVKQKNLGGRRYPAGIAFSNDGKRLYVAENLNDTLAVVDVASGKVLQRLLTGRYPYGVAVARNGRVYVSAWGEDHVAVFRSGSTGLLRSAGTIVVGRHPSSMLLDENGGRLYVVSASTDRVAVVSLATGSVINTLRDLLPSGPGEGATPSALALSRDGSTLYVAESDANSVALFEMSHFTSGRKAAAGADKLAGRIPVEWYPTALVTSVDSLIVVNGKGAGTAPNPGLPQPGKPTGRGNPDYSLGQINGSVMRLPLQWSAGDLASMSRRVAAANGWVARAGAAKYPPFKHVIYIIKENRTYDQVLGDMPQGDGDPALAFFPREISPNHHALADRFGLFDRFFVNAEVSADGHNWSTAAYVTDYVAKVVPSSYSRRGRTYDYEGSNRNQIVDEDDDVAAPANGYLWTLALRKKITLRNYGEFVDAWWGDDNMDTPSAPVPTRRALIDVTNLEYPPWNLDIPDQKRADVWIADLEKYVAGGSMPALQILRLPNDHTSGGSAGRPTPRAYMADNDLALGRIIQALSRSPFWKDSVVFVLEDDAQNGPDHVDSHRSPLLVISPYNHSGLIHRFANTTDVLATIEEILGLDSLSQFDHYGRPLRGIFAAEADLRPYELITPAVDLNEKNPPATPAAKSSERLDFSRPDAADEELLNQVLWSMIKGDTPMPEARRAPAGAP